MVSLVFYLKIRRPRQQARFLIAAIAFSGLGMPGCGDDRSRGNAAAHSGQQILTPQLAAIALDDSLANSNDTVLYGRVTIDGRPVKKGEVIVIAIPTGILNDSRYISFLLPDVLAEQRLPLIPGSEPVYAAVLNDDGLYTAKMPQSGDYRLCCSVNRSLQKNPVVLPQKYLDPFLSSFDVSLQPKQKLLYDIVMDGGAK